MGIRRVFGSCGFVVAVVACTGTQSAIAPEPDGAAPPTDAGTARDAGSDSGSPSLDAAGDAPIDAPACGEFTGDTLFRCSKDGNSRGKCVGDASLVVENCPRGCLRMPPTQDDVCMGTTDTWSCTGSYGTTKALNGDYYLTSFGCWVDTSGTVHTDPADNCIPGCLAKAQQAGLCASTDSGPACEEKVDWFTADAGRFGCLARLRVTNPANGKSLIAVALDFGPACSGEATVQKAVLDASGRVDQYLFGSDQGVSDHALVHVVEVDPSTPLGPLP